MSMYSTTSSGPGVPRNVNSAAQQATQVSTTTLLNAVHTIYTSSQPYRLDASTSLVVNTWLTASQPDHEGRTGGTVDAALSARAWEHARRRAEDGCIVLGYELPPPNIKSFLTRISDLSTNLPLQFSLRSSEPFHYPFPRRCTRPSTHSDLSSTPYHHKVIPPLDNQRLVLR